MRQPFTLVLAAVSAIVVAACGSSPAANPTAASPNWATAAFTPQPAVGLTPRGENLQPTQGFQALIANSHLIVGPNRLALGLIENGRAVKDAKVHLKFYDLNSKQLVPKGEVDAPFYGDNLGEAGVYVTHATFDQAGTWGVEVTAEQSGQPTRLARVGFFVLARDTIPNIGDAAPRSKNPTLKDVNGDRAKLCSAADDDRILHLVSIADALSSGKPTVVLFATPAFCTTRTCGPSLQVVMALAKNYADKVNFIHVEVYKDFQAFALSDAMREWRLETEPWLFFIDKEGKIVARFEGGITSREIVPEFLKFSGQ